MINIIKNDDIKLKFYTFIESYPNIKKLLSEISEQGNLILFGGTVRSYFENNFTIPPRDIDIIVDTKTTDLSNYFKDINFKMNRFGGYKLFIDNIEIDIWAMPITFPFRENLITYKHPSDVVKVPFISYDAIAYNLMTNEIYDNGYLETIKIKNIHIVFEKTKSLPINFVKIIILGLRGYSISEELHQIFKSWINENENYLEILMTTQINHYKKEILNIDDMKGYINQHLMLYVLN